MSPKLECPAGWIVCRKLQQIPVPHVDVLPRWAERGRIRPNDYLVNPGLEICFQVKELPDLNAIFRRKTIWRLLPQWLIGYNAQPSTQ